VPGLRQQGEGKLPVWAVAVALYLTVAAAYVLSSPGRVDIVDGQIRFDVAASWLSEGKPILRDPFVQRYGTQGPDGEIYSSYGAGASVAALPLVWLGGLTDDPEGETRRFFFSLTSPLIGAGIAPLLFLFYLGLGLTRARAVVWALVAAFASLVWQGSTSVFDQAQHGFLVLLSVYFGFVAGRRDSLGLAAVGGLCAGLLVNYQETYALLLPLMAAATLGGSGSVRRGRNRWLAFMAATAFGLALWMGYNWLCFDNPFVPGKLRPALVPHPATSGNVLRGLAGLLLSPGKSVFLYSPTILLGLAGWRALLRRQRELAIAVALTSAVHLAFVSGMSFWHGDWCWGPRYLLILLPLWALAAPFAWRRRRRLVGAVIAAGIVAQLLGLAVVHERFFHERGLAAFFWANDPAFYFRESALLARPSEIRALLSPGPADSARFFSNNPYDSPTYFIAGFPRPELGPRAIRDFQVFQVPRPWPLWMTRLDPQRYAPPVDPAAWGFALVAILVLGVGGTLAGSWGHSASGASPAAGS
jgi:hypothetical protein